MAIFVAAAGDEHIFLRGNEIDATLNERKFIFYVFLIGVIWVILVSAFFSYKSTLRRRLKCLP